MIKIKLVNLVKSIMYKSGLHKWFQSLAELGIILSHYSSKDFESPTNKSYSNRFFKCYP